MWVWLLMTGLLYFQHVAPGTLQHVSCTVTCRHSTWIHATALVVTPWSPWTPDTSPQWCAGGCGPACSHDASPAWHALPQSHPGVQGSVRCVCMLSHNLTHAAPCTQEHSSCCLSRLQNCVHGTYKSNYAVWARYVFALGLSVPNLKPFRGQIWYLELLLTGLCPCFCCSNGCGMMAASGCSLRHKDTAE